MNQTFRTLGDETRAREDFHAEKRKGKSPRSQQIADRSTPPAPDSDEAREPEGPTTDDTPVADGKQFTSCPAPSALASEAESVWDLDAAPASNFERLGQRLAATEEFLRRSGTHAGLLRVTGRMGDEPTIINTGTSLEAAMIDCLSVRVIKGEDTKAFRVPNHELGTMLRSEVFLRAFPPTACCQFSVQQALPEDAN